MLKQLRQKKVMKRILWLLAIIIIPAFVLWGAGGLRESENYAGMLFGKKISFEEFRDSFNAVKNQALLTYGSNIFDMQDRLNLEQASWDRLVLLKEAQRQKIKISDNEVVARIGSFGIFQDRSGFFNQGTYLMILNNSLRTPPRKFEEEIRQSIMIEKLVQQKIGVIAEPTEAEIKEAIKKEAEEKDNKKEEEKTEEEKPKEEKIEETAEQKYQRVKLTLMIEKRIKAYQGLCEDLYKKADFVNNLKEEERNQDIAEESE